MNKTKYIFSVVCGILCMSGIVYAATLPVFSGGTGNGNITYPFNSIITSNSDGTQLIATSSKLTVTTLTATSTTATSTFAYSLQSPCFTTDGTSCLTSGSSAVSDWNKQTNYSVLALTPTTTIPVWFKSTIQASSTIQMDQNTLSIPGFVKYIDWQRDSQTVPGNGYTLMRIRSPKGQSNESTLTLYNDLNGDNTDINVDFTDFYNENYSDSNQGGIRLFNTGTAPQKPFVFGYKTATGNKDGQNVFGMLPSGTVFLANATSTVDQTVKLYIASSTASTIIKADSTPGTNLFTLLSSGFLGISSSTPGSLLSLGTSGGINFTPTATSTFGSSANGISLTNGCFAIGGTCLTQNQGTVNAVTSPITLTGASVGIVNQGTVAQVLHGNASGNASFGAIVNADITNGTIDLTSKVTGILPIANGGTNQSTFAPNVLVGFDGTRQVATGTPQLTIGNLNATSSTAFSHIIDGLAIGGAGQETYQLVSIGTNNTTGIGDLGIMGDVNLGTTNNNTIGFQHSQMASGGSVQTTAGFDFIGNSHTNGAQSTSIAFATRNAGSYGERIRFNFDGKIGIATSSPWRTLSVVGTVAINGLSSATSKDSLCIDTVTKEVVDAGSTTCLASSKYLKNITGNITPEVAKYIVDRMNAITFAYKGQDNQHYGFIAEDVAKIDSDVKQKFGVDAQLAEYANVVTTMNKGTSYEHTFQIGDPIAVDYQTYTAVLTVYMQSLQVNPVTTTQGDNTKVEVFALLAIGILYVIFNEFRRKR